jgi:serine/threonine-protein kinase RsbW
VTRRFDAFLTRAGSLGIVWQPRDCHSGVACVLTTLLASMNPSRESGSSWLAEHIIPSDPARARVIQDEIERELAARHAHEKDVFGIRLALEEALVNAIKHGNQMDPAKRVFVQYRIAENKFEIHIRDEGAGFDPADVPDPTDIENLERPCGRGLMLMRYYMTEVNYSNRGNVVTMSKVFRVNGQKT